MPAPWRPLCVIPDYGVWNDVTGKEVGGRWVRSLNKQIVLACMYASVHLCSSGDDHARRNNACRICSQLRAAGLRLCVSASVFPPLGPRSDNAAPAGVTHSTRLPPECIGVCICYRPPSSSIRANGLVVVASVACWLSAGSLLLAAAVLHSPAHKHAHTHQDVRAQGLVGACLRCSGPTCKHPPYTQLPLKIWKRGPEWRNDGATISFLIDTTPHPGIHNQPRRAVGRPRVPTQTCLHHTSIHDMTTVASSRPTMSLTR